MIELLQRIAAAVQTDQLVREVVAIELGLSATVLLLLALYMIRSEPRGDDGRIRRALTVGLALTSVFFWFGALLGILSLLVLFGSGPIPPWAVVVILGVFASLMALLRAFAKEEV